MLRATIGLVNYTGTACTFAFVKSVCMLPEDIGLDHYKVRQLLALFPGSKVEEVGEGTAVEPMIATAADVAEAPPPEVDPSAETSDVPPSDETPEPEPEAETVEEEVAEEPAAEVEKVVEEAEDEPEPEDEPEDEPENLQEPMGETVEERVQHLVDDNGRPELIEMAREAEVEIGSRATKLEIAQKLVEEQDSDD